MNEELNPNEVQHIRGSIRLDYQPRPGHVIKLLPENKIIIESPGGNTRYGCFKDADEKYEFIKACEKQGVTIDDTTL